MNDGESVFAGSVKLEGNSPWLGVLHAGMWVEAYGHWEADTFVAESVSVVPSEAWSYFQGPAILLGEAAAGYETVRAWTGQAQQLEVLESSVTEPGSVTVVAYHDGTSFLALPSELAPPSNVLAPGWYKLRGVYDGQTVQWRGLSTFP